MAIIYTYPVKATPANDDLILISDSADSNKTKQVKVSSLPGGSSAGVSSLNTLTGAVTITGGTNVTLNTVGNNIEINAAGGGGTPSAPLNSVQFNNNSAFGGSGDFKYNDSTKVLTIGDQDINRGIISIAGGSSGAGELRLGDPGTSGGTVTLKGGNDHAASYTIKLPDDGPSANNKILESDASGNLTWINTPTGTTYSAGTGLSLSGTTFANTDLGSSQYIYKNFTATSGGTATANSNNDTLTLAAGSGITTTRSGDTITIAATGGSGAAGGQTPVDYAVSTGFEATGGSVQYFYIFTCHGDFTLSRMYWYQNASSSQVVTWAIYQGNLSSATLLGQGSATATQSAVNFVTMTAENGQNLNLVKGNTYVIGHQQGGQNGSVACLTSAVSSSGLAVTHAGAGGFPATFPDGELTYTATGIRPCVSLVP